MYQTTFILPGIQREKLFSTVLENAIRTKTDVVTLSMVVRHDTIRTVTTDTIFGVNGRDFINAGTTTTSVEGVMAMHVHHAATVPIRLQGQAGNERSIYGGFWHRTHRGYAAKKYRTESSSPTNGKNRSRGAGDDVVRVKGRNDHHLSAVRQPTIYGGIPYDDSLDGASMTPIFGWQGDDTQ